MCFENFFSITGFADGCWSSNNENHIVEYDRPAHEAFRMTYVCSKAHAACEACIVHAGMIPSL